MSWLRARVRSHRQVAAAGDPEPRGPELEVLGDDAFADVLAGARSPLFVVGSAVSLAAPARGPSALGVTRATMQALGHLAAIPEARDGSELTSVYEPPKAILPESLYSAVAEAYPPGIHAAIWSALEEFRAQGAGPTLAHKLVALVAKRSGGAVLTTNFDRFLEDALRLVGDDPFVVTGKEIWEGERPRFEADHVTVIKVRGDARDGASIVSRSPDLTRTQRVFRLASLDSRFDTAVVAGYSARDLDVFPWLATASGIREFYWIDLPDALDSHDHRSKFLPYGCRIVREEIEKVAAHVLQRWADGGDELARTLLRAHSDDGSPPTGVVERRAEDVAAALPASRVLAARWVLGRAFADIGRHRTAQAVMEVPGSSQADPGDQAELLMLRSFVAASRDRYQDAREHARRAGAVARTLANPRVQARVATRARLQDAYTKVLHSSLALELPKSVPTAHRGARYQILPSIGFALAVVSASPAGVRAVRIARRAAFGELVPSFRLACDYLESLIRLRAFLNFALPHGITVRIMKYLDRLCHEAGYMVGTLNCAKYLRREQGVGSEVGFRGRTAVLNDLVALAIEERDEASRLGPDQQEEFDALSSNALAHAREAGSPSLVLKIAVLRKARGLPSFSSPDEIGELLDEVQAAPVKRQRDNILTWLAAT